MVLKIEKLRRGFLWSRVREYKQEQDHLVSWDLVCKSKGEGGLGFGKISVRNCVLLGKQLWRFPKESYAF